MFLLKPPHFCKSKSILLKLPLDDASQIWVYIVGTLADESKIEDKQDCLLGPAYKIKQGMLRSFPSILEGLQRDIIHLLHLIPNVTIGHEHPPSYFYQLQSPLPLVLDPHHSLIHHTQFTRPILILPIEGLAERQALHS